MSGQQESQASMPLTLTGIHDPSDGVNSHHGAHAHVSDTPVLSRPHIHHPASEMGLLVHEPVAIHHVAGLHLGHAEALLDGLAVFHQLWPLKLSLSYSLILNCPRCCWGERTLTVATVCVLYASSITFIIACQLTSTVIEAHVH